MKTTVLWRKGIIEDKDELIQTLYERDEELANRRDEKTHIMADLRNTLKMYYECRMSEPAFFVDRILRMLTEYEEEFITEEEFDRRVTAEKERHPDVDEDFIERVEREGLDAFDE